MKYNLYVWDETEILRALVVILTIIGNLVVASTSRWFMSIWSGTRSELFSYWYGPGSEIKGKNDDKYIY